MDGAEHVHGLDHSATFQTKLRHLMQTMTKPSGETYSYRELAAAIKARGFDGPSAAYLNQLATGARSDPKISHVLGIAAAFGVPGAYFFDDEVSRRVDEQLTALHEQQRREWELRLTDDARLIAYRAGELSDRGRRQVMDLLDVVYRLEQQESASREPGRE